MSLLWETCENSPDGDRTYRFVRLYGAFSGGRWTFVPAFLDGIMGI